MAKYKPSLGLRIAVSAAATCIFAWFVFIGAPLMWHHIEANFTGVDWQPVFLAAFVVAYFVAGIWVWEDSLLIIAALRHEQPASLLWTVPLLLLAPAGAVLAIIARGAGWLIEQVFSGLLHDHAQKVAKRAAGALALIWASVYAILLFANLWQPADEQCAWVFPRIATCLLTKHDGLAGGVIGAGGTIFAGWLAWTVVQAQISSVGESGSSQGRPPPKGRG